MTATRSAARPRRLLADQHAQHVRRRRIVAVAGAVADALDRHRRNRAERRGVGRHDQRAGRRHELLLHRAAVDRRVAEQPHRRRRRHRKHAVRRAPPCRRRRSAASRRSRSAPTHSMREHGADDVDDRVEGADLVQVHLLDRHLVDGRLGLRRAAGTSPSRDRARRRQRRAVDHLEDLRQVTVGVGLARRRVRGSWFRVQGRAARAR